MTQQQALIVLDQVKTAVGARYKSLIRQAWENGNYSPLGLAKWESELQRIRNLFGPSWLNRPLTPGQVAALEWLKQTPGLLIPHTTNPPYCWKWDDHKPASVAAFQSLEKAGFAVRRDNHFWHLTPAGEAIAN